GGGEEGASGRSLWVRGCRRSVRGAQTFSCLQGIAGGDCKARALAPFVRHCGGGGSRSIDRRNTLRLRQSWTVLPSSNSPHGPGRIAATESWSPSSRLPLREIDRTTLKPRTTSTPDRAPGDDGGSSPSTAAPILAYRIGLTII